MDTRIHWWYKKPPLDWWFRLVGFHTLPETNSELARNVASAPN